MNMSLLQKNFFIKMMLLLVTALAAACTPGSREIPVEAILPVSGQYSGYGLRLQAGMQTAIARLNKERAAKGQNLLVLNVTDTRSSPQGALDAFRKAAQRDRSVIIGPGPTDETRRLIHAANSMRIPLLMPIASGDNLTVRGNFLFRTCFTDAKQARAISNYIFDELQLKEIAVMIDLHNEGSYGRNLSQDIARNFRARGGRVTVTEGFRNSDPSFREQIYRIMSVSPEAIFIPAIADSAAKFVREARLLGYEGWIIGGDAMAEPEFLNQLGDEAGDILFASQYSPDAGTTESSVFKTEFAGLYDYLPGDCEALGYDSVLLAVTARENADSFQAGWRNIQGLELVSGPFKLDSNSNAAHPVYLNTAERNTDTGLFCIKTIKICE